jgi:AraC-like DNA-binding protein
LVTADAEQACQELADAFGTQIHMTTSTPEGVFRLEHIDAGRFCTGQHELPGRLSFTSEPAAQVVVARLLAGTAHRRTPTGEERLGPDDVFLTGQPATVHTAATTNTRVRTVTLPLPLLHKVAGELPGQGSPLRFTALRPATPALAAHWRATRVYVKDLLDRPDLDTAAPLLAANVAHLLAATALVVFPNTVTASADGPHDRTATPGTVRRAMAFIEEHADRDITLADIASAACVTPRALQYAFRRHLDTTPLAYLRDARLHRAHHDLVDADPALDTVTRIAARWGFLHPGRFATRYQQAYHCTPSSTLHA